MARPTIGKLVTLTSARSFAVQYRLAPQNPFPAALLNVFIAYLSLLRPAEGSYHDAVPASSIVLSGDSSGLNLCLALVQLLLKVRESERTLRIHGRKVCPGMPAGVAGLSGYLDLTFGLPSDQTNSESDVLLLSDPYRRLDRPLEPCWPADPPRGDIYCEISALCHPLTSPVNALSWVGAPPMWLACGQERMADASKAVAQQAARHGVIVQFEEYDAMPHIWPLTMPKLPQARMVIDKWASVCLQLRNGGFESSATRITAEGREMIPLDVKNLLPLSQDQVRGLTREQRARRQPYVRLTNPQAHI